ncbi:MAG: CPBP family intramembrane metalloprotease [Deltaproteobacteria bacterium]|nr:MAG: CPBP family intramembrane metalloprotease [Deltaproteobacteria bacterium]
MLRALGIVFGLTGVLAVIQLLVPATSSVMQVGLAIILLQAPTWVLKKTPAEEAALGMTLGPWGRGLRLGGLTMAVVFPLFVLGYHLVHTQWLGLHADWDSAHLVRWDEDLEHAPPAPCGRADGASAWLQGDGLWVVAPPRGHLVVTVATEPPVTDGRVIVCRPGKGAVVGAPTTAKAGGLFALEEGEGVWVPLGARDAIEVRITDGGKPIPAARLHLGAKRVEAGDDGGFDASRSWLWLLTYVIVHLGLVALPEEWFFRGYLQGRLDLVLGTPLRVFGVQVGWGLVLSALAFALLHPILLPGFHRLLVFFPALLFGWLRARSGNVGASILVHAGSNVLLAVVSRMYL